MNRTALFTKLLYLGMLASGFSAFGQSAPSFTAATVSGTRDAQFNLLNPVGGEATFYLFGDGNFSLQNNPLHEFNTNGTYTTEVFHVEKYVDSPPSTASAYWDTSLTINQQPLNGYGSSTTIPFLGNKSIRIGQSWRAAEGHDLILIVSFTNPCDPTQVPGPVSGQVELHLDQNVNFVQDYTASYASLNSIGSSSLSGFGDKIVWDFINLDQGETRNVYAQINIPDGTSAPKFQTQADLIVNSPEACMDSHSKPIKRYGYAHDPNGMEVDFTCIQPWVGASQVLEYTVYFYNDGSYFAKDVLVESDITTTLSINNIDLVDSSAPCTIGLNSNGQVEVLFSNINLPGVNQNMPNTYSYDQCTGYVVFSVCLDDQLAPGNIHGNSVIYFDALPGIGTSSVLTEISNSCAVGNICNANDNTGDGEESESIPQLNIPSTYTSTLKAYPNPFSNELEIAYSVSEFDGANVQISLRSITGQQINSLNFKSFKESGNHKMNWDMSQIPAGTYILTVQTENQLETCKLVKF